MKIPRSHPENGSDIKPKDGSIIKEKSMKRKVVCSICGEELSVKGKTQFRHCGKLQLIENNMVVKEKPEVEKPPVEKPETGAIIEEKEPPKKESVKRRAPKVEEKMVEKTDIGEGWGFF